MSKTIVSHKAAEFLKSIDRDSETSAGLCFPLAWLSTHIMDGNVGMLSETDERDVLTAITNEDGWEEEKPQQYQAYMKLPGRLSPTSSMYLYAIHGISGKGIAYSYNDDLYKATAASFFTRDELVKYGLTDSVLTIRPVPDKGGDDNATD